jgi:hypothetical protein
VSWPSKYSETQRAAIVAALEDGLDATMVSALAASGELTDRAGFPLPGFTIPASTVRDFRRKAKYRRDAERRDLLLEEPRDTVEQLRQDLLRVVHAELRGMQREKHGTRDLDRVRQAARALRELAAVSGPGPGRPPRPGYGPVAERVGGVTRGGLAESVLKAHRDRETTPGPLRAVDDDA